MNALSVLTLFVRRQGEHLSCEVMVWLSDWSTIQMIWMWSSLCHYHPIIILLH